MAGSPHRRGARGRAPPLRAASEVSEGARLLDRKFRHGAAMLGGLSDFLDAAARFHASLRRAAGSAAEGGDTWAGKRADGIGQFVPVPGGEREVQRMVDALFQMLGLLFASLEQVWVCVAVCGRTIPAGSVPFPR